MRRARGAEWCRSLAWYSDSSLVGLSGVALSPDAHAYPDATADDHANSSPVIHGVADTFSLSDA
ncbi:hypothetical protein J7643_12735 [bacterium]|nr:hypothetical protein [bacterium]